jgi:hypothetical protein
MIIKNLLKIYTPIIICQASKITASSDQNTGDLPSTVLKQETDLRKAAPIPLNAPSSINSDAVPGPTPARPNPIPRGGVPKDEEPVGSLLSAFGKTGRILQHFAIRSPHVLIATAVVYSITHYYFNDPKQALENAAFVGTASAVYCFVKPFFLETIPSSLIGSDNKVWRELVNVTYTVFPTLMLSSCVWGLKVPALKGLAIWAASFGSSISLLQKAYAAIDGDFKANP